MIIGTGVDMALVSRIERVADKFPERFAHRILHPDERAAWRRASSPTHFLTKRFAAKEAAAKALGTAIREGVAMQDFVIEPDQYGKPHLRVVGRAAQEASARGITRWHLSITDEGDTVIAYVIAEGRE
ncbi:MAG: holo-ACP synthase [Granulosicoccaceae bacterium]